MTLTNFYLGREENAWTWEKFYSAIMWLESPTAIFTWDEMSWSNLNVSIMYLNVPFWHKIGGFVTLINFFTWDELTMHGLG